MTQLSKETYLQNVKHIQERAIQINLLGIEKMDLFLEPVSDEVFDYLQQHFKSDIKKGHDKKRFFVINSQSCQIFINSK